MPSTKPEKLGEAEARDLALKIAAGFPGREATTTQIKQAIPKHRTLTAEDLKPSKTRFNETMWEQIVGNVVSHQENSTSIFNKGYAIRTDDGIRVTDTGVAYLKAEGLI